MSASGRRTISSLEILHISYNHYLMINPCADTPIKHHIAGTSPSIGTTSPSFLWCLVIGGICHSRATIFLCNLLDHTRRSDWSSIGWHWRRVACCTYRIRSLHRLLRPWFVILMSIDGALKMDGNTPPGTSTLSLSMLFCSLVVVETCGSWVLTT